MNFYIFKKEDVINHLKLQFKMLNYKHKKIFKIIYNNLNLKIKYQNGMDKWIFIKVHTF